MSTQQPTDPKTFFESPEAIALVVNPAGLFGLLTRSYDVPQSQAALVTRKQGDRVVRVSGQEISGDEVAALLLVRTTPLVVRFDDLHATSVDHYRCAASVTVRVSLIPETSELRSFERAIVGSARGVGIDGLREYLRPHLTRSLALMAEGRGVEVLTDPKDDAALATEVADGLKAATFGAGLRIERPIDVQLDSAVYRQVQRARARDRRRREEFATARRIEQATEAAQLEHTRHLAELLEKLRSLANRSPDHELAEVLRTFPEGERGELYAALFGADDARQVTGSVVVGSGRELLFFDPQSFDAPQSTIMMPDTIGPVRSVQIHLDASDEWRLFVGASRGVHEMPADGTGTVITYATDAGDDVKGGVNSVALAGDRIFASHSELGLLHWPRGGERQPSTVMPERTRRAKAVRCVRFFAGAVFFSTDDEINRLPADAIDEEPITFSGSRSLITSICPAVDGLYAGNAVGQILFWPEGDTTQPETLHAGRQRSAESVTLLDFGGLRRLFYTDTSLAVFARVVGDTFTCRYEAGGQTLRRVEVAPDVIIATNDVRDRLIVWTPGQPASPRDVVPIARLTGHSIQDVALIPAT